MLPTEGLEAITGLIPIKSYLHKLMGKSQLCSASLPENYLIKNLIDDPLNIHLNTHSHYYSVRMWTDFRVRISG